MRTAIRNYLLSISFLVLAGAAAAQQSANLWPSKPVRLLVGFPGGSTPDLAARAISEPLSRLLGQPVVVDNRPGASGNIATAMVAKATDGHTFGVVINGNLTSAKALNPSLPYDPSKDFSYLSLIATSPLILVTGAGLPAGRAFPDAAKASGNQWNYASVGVGSLGHLGMELLKSRLPGFSAEHVPYQGNPQIATALLGGQVQLALMPPGIALPHIKSGKLQSIGLTGEQSSLAPGVGSLAEVGIRDYALEVWVGLVGPASMSATERERMAQDLARVFQMLEVQKSLLERGWTPVGSTSEGMRIRIEKEADAMARIIRTKGIRLD